MPEPLNRIMDRFKAELAVATGTARQQFDRRRGTIQVLTYHGVIPDAMADRPWVPSHLLAVSRFERQMEALAEIGPAPTLADALARLDADADAPPVICITFDDGCADNASVVLPILQKHGHQATFFLATGLVDWQGYLPGDMLRVLGLLNGAGKLPESMSGALSELLAEPGKAKRIPRADYMDELESLWSAHHLQADVDAIEHLRMMSWDGAYRLRDAGMVIGAHTANHVVLGAESAEMRRTEIELSVRRVREMIGTESVPFAYPNGNPGDYDESDMAVLEELGVPFAVTQTPGWITPETPRLALQRQSISRDCTQRAFLAHVYGVRIG